LLEIPEYQEILQYTTIKILIYLKTHRDKPIGVRKTQRDLGIKSPATVSWHFDKLGTHGYIVKNEDNSFSLTEKTLSLKNLSVPSFTRVQFFRGYVFPKVTFLLSFNFILLILTILAWLVERDPLVIGINGGLGLITTVGILSYEFISLKKELSG
jgi:hypothetical protein